MKKAYFIKDGFVDGELVFKKGETYELSEKSGSHSRWIRRGIAIDPVEQGKELEVVELKETVETVEKTAETKPEQAKKGQAGKGHKKHAQVDDL